MTSDVVKNVGAKDERTGDERRKDRAAMGEGRYATVDGRRPRSTHAVSPLTKYPRHSSPNDHLPRQSTHRRDDEIAEYEVSKGDRNRDYVIALRATDNLKKPTTQSKSKYTVSPRGDNTVADLGSSSRKRRLSKERLEVELSKVNKQSKLASKIVNETEQKDAKGVLVPGKNVEISKSTDCPIVKNIATETVNNKKEVTNHKDVAGIELNGTNGPNDSLTVEDYNVYCLDEDNKDVTEDCYGDLLDYGGSEGDLQINMLFDSKNKAVEKEIIPGYPFRYNISANAQKQINDIIYTDVAVAVSNMQRTLKKVVEEKCALENRCKELEGIAALKVSEVEGKFHSQIEDAEKKRVLIQDERDEMKKII